MVRSMRLYEHIEAQAVPGTHTQTTDLASWTTTPLVPECTPRPHAGVVRNPVSGALRLRREPHLPALQGILRAPRPVTFAARRPPSSGLFSPRVRNGRSWRFCGIAGCTGQWEDLGTRELPFDLCDGAQGSVHAAREALGISDPLPP